MFSLTDLFLFYFILEFTSPQEPQALSTRIRFKSSTFSLRIRFPTTNIRRLRQRIQTFLNPLSRVEKNNFSMSPISYERVNLGAESGYFRRRWRGKLVSSLLKNNKPIWRHNSNNRAYLLPLSRALLRMLWTHFIAEELCVFKNLVPRASVTFAQRNRKTKCSGKILFE